MKLLASESGVVANGGNMVDSHIHCLGNRECMSGEEVFELFYCV